MKLLLIAAAVMVTACSWQEGEFLRVETETMTVQERVAWNSSWLLGEEAHYNRDGSTLIDGIELRDGYMPDQWAALLDNGDLSIQPHPTVSQTETTCHQGTGFYLRACKIDGSYHVTAGDVGALVGLAGMLQTPVQTAATYDEEGAELTPSILSRYMSTGLIDEPFADILPLDEWDGEQYVRAREPDYEAIIAASGGAATQEQLEPILAAAVITDESWRTTLYNLGQSI